MSTVQNLGFRLIEQRRRRMAGANSAPNLPTLSAGTLTSSGATLTGSAFSDPDVGDTHAASQWQVTTAADTGFASPVYNPGDDATNKTSLVWSGGSASTGYLARVRYKDNHGNYSLWATSASFTTAAGGAHWATAKAFDFRSTLGFVTDPANTQFVGPSFAYPQSVTIGGETVVCGWETVGTLTGADRNNASDPRVAGCVFSTAGTQSVFRVDLKAAGSHTIHAAFGDPQNVQTMTYAVKDGTTATPIAKTNVAPTGGANTLFDAAGTAFDFSTWPGGEVGVTYSFATTILRVALGDASNRAFLAHISITQN